MTQVCPRRYLMYYPQTNVHFWGDVLFKSSIYFQFVVTERCKKQYHVWNNSPDFYKPAVCDCQMSVRSFLTYNQSLTDLLSGCPVGARLRCTEPTGTTKKAMHVFNMPGGGAVFLPWTGSGIKCRARTHDSSVSLQHPVQKLASFPCILAAQR